MSHCRHVYLGGSLWAVGEIALTTPLEVTLRGAVSWLTEKSATAILLLNLPEFCRSLVMGELLSTVPDLPRSPQPRTETGYW